MSSHVAADTRVGDSRSATAIGGEKKLMETRNLIRVCKQSNRT